MEGQRYLNINESHYVSGMNVTTSLYIQYFEIVLTMETT